MKFVINNHEFEITKHLNGEVFKWHEWKTQDITKPTLRFRLHRRLGFVIEEIAGSYILTLRYRLEEGKDWLIGWDMPSFKTINLAKFNAYRIWNDFVKENATQEHEL